MTDIERRYANAYSKYRACEDDGEREIMRDILRHLREEMRAEWVRRGIITEEQFMRAR